MSNMFYIPVRDEAGNIQAGVSVGAYTDLACTSLATLVAPGPTSNPFTTDSDGDQFIYVSDTNVEMLYFRCVGQTVVVPIRCANKPLFNDYTADATPANADLFIFEVAATGLKYKLTFAELVDAIEAKSILDKTFIDGVNGIGTANITVTVDDVAASGGSDGDIWFQVP